MVAAPRAIVVQGGGPAGTAAAIAARAEGASVTIYEQARSPRHKVCGEFLPAEAASALQRLGVWRRFMEAGPARITRAVLHFGRSEKRFRIPEPAYSLSRLAFDAILLDQALACGAHLRRERARPGGDATVVLAHGRNSSTPRGEARLFGFKAHFHGAADDAVELFFFGRSYVGVSAVEGSVTNVCGLAPEDELRAVGFRPDRLFPQPLAARLRDLEPSFDWLMTGPVTFGYRAEPGGASYLAGDAFGFVDPFTGSGMVNALTTGMRAGSAAARGLDPREHHAACRRILRAQYGASAALRALLASGLAGALARWTPPRLLYTLTRPATVTR